MSATSSAIRFGQLTVEPMLGGISIAGLAALINPEHEANNLIEAVCSQGCGEKFSCRQFFASLTACDSCRDKADKKEKLERAKIYWESICDESFRDTDKNHPQFPKSQYEATKGFAGTESLFLFGPSGKGKSRLGMILLKRCLVRYNMHVGVLWPEELSAVKGARGRETLDMIAKWGRYDVLLMDDSILAGAQDGRVTDFLKQLLDYRMRHKRHQIVTSQIGSAEYMDQADKFKEATRADKQLIEALLRRVREACKVISFADSNPQPGQVDF
jgi:DNA replication protein DnaC